MSRRLGKRARNAMQAQPQLPSYETLRVSRIAAIVLTVLWLPVWFLLGAGLLYLEDWVAQSLTGSVAFHMALITLTVSLVLPFFLACSMRCWTIDGPVLRIRERPFIPPFGRYRRADIALADIVAVRFGVLAGGFRAIEVESRDATRFLITADTIGMRHKVRPDDKGIAAFAEQFRRALRRAGGPLPLTGPMERPVQTLRRRLRNMMTHWSSTRAP